MASTASKQAAPAEQAGAALPGQTPVPRSETDDLAHLGHGVVAGALGAAIVAIIFLLIDTMTVGALATPNALGRSFFFGEAFGLEQPLSLTAIVAYSALHGGAFVAVAYFGAALAWAMREHVSDGVATALVCAAVFVGCQAGITSFAFVSQFPAAEFDLVRVAYANFLAALVMARVLVKLVGSHDRLLG